jgi:hypothetical protein
VTLGHDGAASACPLWSRTTKRASNPSTDHGGGKRREGMAQSF